MVYMRDREKKHIAATDTPVPGTGSSNQGAGCQVLQGVWVLQEWGTLHTVPVSVFDAGWVLGIALNFCVQKVTLHLSWFFLKQTRTAGGQDHVPPVS